MTTRNTILQELEALKSRLPAQDPEGKIPFTVPAGYFEQLPDLLLSRVKAMKASTVQEETAHMAPSLAQGPVSDPYTVPEGYFENLPARIMARLEAEKNLSAGEELAALSPLLSSLKKDNPYSVPEGYFEQALPPRQTAAPAGRVISLFRRPLVRLAAAAVVTGIIALTAWLFINAGPETGEKAVARFEKKLNKELDKMTDKELTDFIQLTDPAAAPQDEVLATATGDGKDWLKDIPESELKEFLDETSASDTPEESIMLN